MKKILALSMALIMLLSMFVSCGGPTTTTPNDTTTATPDDTTTGTPGGDVTDPDDTTTGTIGGDVTDPDDTTTANPDEHPVIPLPDMDMDGYKYRIIGRPGEIIDMFSTADATDPVQQSVYIRNQLVMAKYNCEIVEKYFPSDDPYGSNKLAEILIGVDNYDLLAPHGRLVAPYIFQGATLDLHTMPYLNIYQDWWMQKAREAFTVEGCCFAIQGDLSFMGRGAAYSLPVNRDILEDNGFDMPYDEVVNYEWTFDMFAEMCETCADDTNGDGVYDPNADDIFGYSSGSWAAPYCVTFATGTRIIGHDENGELIITLGNEIVYDALADLFDLMEKPGMGWELTNKVDQFISGRLLFMDITLYEVSLLLSKTDVNYGVLPYPITAPGVQDYSAHIAGARNLFFVPTTVVDLEKSSIVLDALAQQGADRIIPLFYDNILALQAMPTEDDYTMFEYITNAGLYDIGYFWSSVSMSGLLQKIGVEKSEESFWSEYNSAYDSTLENLEGLVIMVKSRK